MPSRAEDFLSFAKAVNGTETGAEEIGQRAIVNRGYYAVFHLATDIANRMALPELSSTRGGSHQKLFNRLIQVSGRPESERLVLQCIGYIASRTLKPFRFSADYDINNPLPSDAAAQTLANAEKVFSKSALLNPIK